MSLIEGIQQECNRLREVAKLHDEIGPMGAIGAAFIRQHIARGEAAIASGDVVEMVVTAKYLQEQDHS